MSLRFCALAFNALPFATSQCLVLFDVKDIPDANAWHPVEEESSNAASYSADDTFGLLVVDQGGQMAPATLASKRSVGWLGLGRRGVSRFGWAMERTNLSRKLSPLHLPSNSVLSPVTPNFRSDANAALPSFHPVNFVHFPPRRKVDVEGDEEKTREAPASKGERNGETVVEEGREDR
ncbi:hypothetical protein BD410DRAFT_809658 [Rickenella mellea]|uniref:Secreted protein n=1 Tax=Rickenella mellea TaxID=50990 RepID=A0A4Y7PGJ6_9AGAM|nr:hypothetical protein BD410DRAFT_809658 [Rickenella mellea]